MDDEEGKEREREIQGDMSDWEKKNRRKWKRDNSVGGKEKDDKRKAESEKGTRVSGRRRERQNKVR